MRRPDRCPTPRRRSGFTLIELMVAVAIIGVLAALAYPSYTGAQRKGRRSDAVSALTAAQQSQERYRANNPIYAPSLAALQPAIPAVSQNGYYNLSVENNPPPDGVNYILSAQAVAGTSQASDTNCSTMRIQVIKGNIFYGGCNACAAPVPPATVTDPNRCWAK